MNFIAASIFWLIGLFVTSFTILPILIILRFGIPFTKELEEKNLLVENHKIIKNYKTSIILLLSIFTILTIILFFTTESGFRGFIGGCIMALIIGIWKTGKNKSNIADYMQTNDRFFKKD